jgi:iron complex transport system permease protein
MTRGTTLALLGAFAALTLVVTPFIGMETIPLSTVLGGGEGVESTIFWDIRLPRVLTAFIAGIALALSGMTFQAMFRNPLATPFTLGVSSGASLGATIAIQSGLTFTFLGVTGTTLAAFIGAMAAIALVYGLTQIREGFSTATMLLAGVAVNFFFASLILFIQYTADVYNSFRMLRWIMGGMAAVDYEAMFNVLPFALAGLAILWFMTNELNLLTTGDDLAMSRGVDVPRTKRLLFITVSMMVGGVVAICGPIGFVGMMVPHMCRLMVGPDHRYLAPASCLFGGAFLTLCDTFARTILAPAELPVGVVTALLGGPFFIWLLLSSTNRDIA